MADRTQLYAPRQVLIFEQKCQDLAALILAHPNLQIELEFPTEELATQTMSRVNVIMAQIIGSWNAR